MGVWGIRIIIYFIACVFLAACVHSRSERVGIVFGERESLYFTGRGSAAGVMMDSLLAGTGVAIGIAIDEGIAKDIAAAIFAHNPEFSMISLVAEELHKSENKGLDFGDLHLININKYGFQAAANDAVVPLIEFQLKCSSGAFYDVKFTPDHEFQTIAFDQAKVNGQLVQKQLRSAVERLFASTQEVCP